MYKNTRYKILQEIKESVDAVYNSGIKKEILFKLAELGIECNTNATDLSYIAFQNYVNSIIDEELRKLEIRPLCLDGKDYELI
jgi:hypothetical protein